MIAYTGEQLMAEIDKLHKAGGEFATCPGPNRFEVNSTNDYVLKWDNVGIPSISLNEQAPLEQIIVGYRNIYRILFAPKYCGTITPPPPIDEVPVDDSVRVAYEAWQAARDTEQRLMDEFVKLVNL